MTDILTTLILLLITLQITAIIVFFKDIKRLETDLFYIKIEIDYLKKNQEEHKIYKDYIHTLLTKYFSVENKQPESKLQEEEKL